MASSRAGSPPRIVIYGVGQFGQYVARLAHEKGWPIVAAYNRAGDKVGRDLGELAGIGRELGVPVQDCDTADFAVEADIGVVTVSNSLARNLPAYQRLMGAGLNVICLGIQACYPRGCDAALAREIDDLATANGVTFTGGGVWDVLRIWSGILLAGQCTEIRRVHHTSLTDAEVVPNQMVLTGAGLTLAEARENAEQIRALIHVYKTVPEHVLAALGYAVTGERVTVEPITFDEPYLSPVLGREIPAGDCVGTRAEVELETTAGVVGTATMEFRVLHEGEHEYAGWSIDGRPSASVRTAREDTAHATASCIVNRIPDVIAAQPGIVLVSELGPMRHSARF